MEKNQLRNPETKLSHCNTEKATTKPLDRASHIFFWGTTQRTVTISVYTYISIVLKKGAIGKTSCYCKWGSVINAASNGACQKIYVLTFYLLKF